ncbi:hypothetical protein [Estrella lausannensis]|uniref:Conserved putative membrane protein n=1 Tax=Estrella lausannensis TaxID=483423 RepID=A0A0H5DPS8_9BACT|nr:hypothetical protein [Estrella lausannensis]CRX38482.1 Conserved putative membrane protein [Estrella lausannensis]
MLKALRLFLQSDPKTKSFILSWAIYMSVLLGSAVYCYVRLDAVRSGPKAAPETENVSQ